MLLNLTTAGLIIFGGLASLVILDVAKKKSFKKLAFHSKVVISTSIVLTVAGTLLLKGTEDITWLGAFFQSVSARTAGFSTYAIGDFTNAGLFVLCVLMFIGASPGSTGGGIKTSTFFVLLQAARSACVKRNASAFKRGISRENIAKASMITVLSMTVVCVATFLLCVLEPDRTFIQVFFEVVVRVRHGGAVHRHHAHVRRGGQDRDHLRHVYRETGGVHPADDLDQPSGAEAALLRRKYRYRIERKL